MIVNLLLQLLDERGVLLLLLGGHHQSLLACRQLLPCPLCLLAASLGVRGTLRWSFFLSISEMERKIFYQNRTWPPSQLTPISPDVSWFFLLSLFKLFIAYLSLPSSKSWVVNPYVFFSIFFQIFSPYHFFISIQMFSLRKYFPHFISPSQSRYFFPSYFPYLSSPSQSNNYFPSPIISLFFFTVLLPPNYPFSSFLFLLCFPSVSWVSS